MATSPPLSSEPAIRIERLSKSFAVPWRRERVQAVQDLTLSVETGQVYGLLGPNGSGKSTTMKIVLGVLRPDSGGAQIFGIESQMVESRVAVGFLPENPYFYRYLTGLETLRFYGRLCLLEGRELEERCRELLALVGLEEAADRRLAGYSKGMLQRIGLAQALVQRPRLLVLDEPTAGVDPAGSRQIKDLILQFKTQGITILLCSHLLSQVQEICDRIGIMHRGCLIREGALQDLIAVDHHTEMVFDSADPHLLAAIRQTIQANGAHLLRETRPQTTLEDYFLEVTREDRSA